MTTFFIAIIIGIVLIIYAGLNGDIQSSPYTPNRTNPSTRKTYSSLSQSLEEECSAKELKTLKKELNLVNLNRISDVEMLKFIENLDTKLDADTPTLQMVKDLSLSQIRTTMKELKRILNDMDLKEGKTYSSNEIASKSTLTREELNLPPQEEYIEEVENTELENNEAGLAGAILGWMLADSLHEDNSKKFKREKEKLRRQMQDDFHFYSPEIARDYLLDMDKEDLD